MVSAEQETEAIAADMIEENGFNALIEKVPWLGETWDPGSVSTSP